MKTRDILIDNRKIRIHEWSNNEQFPTIFSLHGLGGSGLNIIEIAENLRNYNVISVDLPGHGGTEELGDDYSMISIVEWMNSLFLELGLNNVYIVGHSYGADVAIHFASKYRKKVNGLFLLDGGYYNKSLQYRFIEKFYKENQWPSDPMNSIEKECEAYKNDFDNYIFSTMDKYLEQEVQSYSRMSDSLILALQALVYNDNEVYRWRVTGDIAVKALKGMYENPSALKLAELNLPMKLLVADLPNHYAKLRHSLIAALGYNEYLEIEVLEGTNHFLHWDKPKDVTRILLDFLGKYAIL